MATLYYNKDNVWTKVDISGGGDSGGSLPSGGTTNKVLFGDSTWVEPVLINDNTFRSRSGTKIYAPTSKPTGTGIKYFAFNASNYPTYFTPKLLALSGISLTTSLAANTTFQTIDLSQMSSVSFVAIKPDGGSSVTTLNQSAIQGYSSTGNSVAITNDALRMYFTIDVSSSQTKIVTGVGNYGTSGNVFKSFMIYPQY